MSDKAKPDTNLKFTDEDLKRLEELHEKAIPAPWKNTPWEVEGSYVYGPDDDSILTMLWPRHPPTPEATRAAEVQTYTACDLIKELRNKIGPLLNRLECAERLAATMQEVDHGCKEYCCAQFMFPYEERLEAWLKSKGERA